MGYMPYGNACQARPGDCPVLNNAKEIDRRLGRLYAWCVDHNVPVMSHTSHSFGETDSHDDCAAPYGWQKALDKFDGLRIQAGHFGGDSHYALDKAWAAEYVRLMALPILIIKNKEHLNEEGLEQILQLGLRLRAPPKNYGILLNKAKNNHRND